MPNDPDAGHRLVSLGADRPLDLYNPEKAFDLLERAVSAGFNNRQLLTSDEDLATLRPLPRFQALVERVKPPA